MSERATAAPIPTGNKVAFWRRLGAFLVDAVILAFPITALFGVFGYDDGRDVAGLAALLGISGFYHVLATMTDGQTRGKKLFDLRVVAIDGSPLSWKAAALRWAGYLPSLVPAGLGCLWCLWDRDGQTWHDKMASTTVIRGPQAWIGLLPADLAQRRQRRWLMRLGAPSLLVLVGTALLCEPQLLITFFRATANTTQWVDRSASAQDAVGLDLSPVGLQLVEVRNARAEGVPGEYHDGAVGVYQHNGELALQIVVVRWETNEQLRREIGSDLSPLVSPMDVTLMDKYCPPTNCQPVLVQGEKWTALIVAHGPRDTEIRRDVLQYLAKGTLTPVMSEP